MSRQMTVAIAGLGSRGNTLQKLIHSTILQLTQITLMKDSVDLIRDSLFSIQVQQPWLLLQYNSSDIESIGIDRVESLLSTSPDSNNGEDREKIVAEEIEDRSNTNMTITKTINRLGTVFFLFVFNIGISIFVFLLTGIMIFSQVLFIIYAMFLPVSFILSMIPSFDGMSKRAITKLFNTILTRAGITLIITTAFSISTMLYTLSAGYPFFLIAFLQIVTFAGIYFKLGDLMSMFSLQSNDSQSVGSRMMRKPRMLMHAHMHRLQRKLGRSVTALGAGSAIASATGKKGQSGSGSSASTQADHSRPNGQEKSTLAGFVSMVPYMMKDVHQLSTAEIGSVIIFPGTMSVIIFGYIGGILVDRRGPLYVLNIGVTFLSVSFLTASFLLETTSWFMTIIIVFVLGGLSFTKTVISTIVSSSLKQQEAGAGMSLLNFTSFLSEGTGIAIVGGLLSIPLLDQRLLPMEVDQSTYLYSNLLLLFSGIIVISWLVTLNVYKHSQRDF